MLAGGLLVFFQTLVYCFLQFSEAAMFGAAVLSWIVFLAANCRHGLIVVLTRAVILSVPTSFVNILGGSYGDMPVSWFNLFALLLVLALVFTNNFPRRFDGIALYSCFLTIFFIIPVIAAGNVADALKQYLNILVPLLFLIMGKNSAASYRRVLSLDYIAGGMATAAAVFLQVINYYIFGASYGNLVLMGGDRLAFGVIFADYSFLSLYLTTTAALAVLTIPGRIRMPATVVILLAASMVTSARAGVVAFLITLGVRSVMQLARRPAGFGGSLLITVGVGAAAYMLLEQVRPENALGDSGRIDSYLVGLAQLEANPLTGAGFGVNEYVTVTGAVIPHNIFVQFLAQAGAPGAAAIAVFLAWLVYSVKSNESIFLAILCAVVGAQFIPDIFSSRFFPALIIIAAGCRVEQEVTEDEDAAGKTQNSAPVGHRGDFRGGTGGYRHNQGSRV